MARSFTRRQILLFGAALAIAGCASPAGQPAGNTPVASTQPTPAGSTANATPTKAAAGGTTPAAATPSAAASTGGSGGGKIKIVSSLPMQGPLLAQTSSCVNGFNLALEQANKKAGNFDITFEAWDDAIASTGNWDGGQEAANANKAANDSDIMVYIGTFNSGAAKVSMPILNKVGLAMISPANTYPGLTKPGKGTPEEPGIYRPTGKLNYFRVIPADDIQGPVGAVWGKSLGAKKVYILDDQETYGKGIADLFEKKAKEIGLDVAGHEGIDPKASDYKALMTKIKAAGVDFVYFGGTSANNPGQLVKDMKNVGLNAKFMGPDGINDTAYLEAGGKDAEGTYSTFGGGPASQLKGKGLTFYNDYKKKYNAEPESYAVYAYEAINVAMAAIAKAGKKDRAAIVDAIKNTKNYEGALGTWSFDENGDTTLQTMGGYIAKPKDGKLEWEFVSFLEAK